MTPTLTAGTATATGSAATNSNSSAPTSPGPTSPTSHNNDSSGVPRVCDCVLTDTDITALLTGTADNNSTSSGALEKSENSNNNTTFKKYKRFQFLQSHVNARECPYDGCGHLQIGDSSNNNTAIICGKCRYTYCLLHANAHPTMTCADYTMMTSKDLEVNMNFIQETSKPCPSCGRMITKSGGCNHMKCMCGTNFCWLCGKQVDDGVFPRHFQWWNANRCSNLQMANEIQPSIFTRVCAHTLTFLQLVTLGPLSVISILVSLCVCAPCAGYYCVKHIMPLKHSETGPNTPDPRLQRVGEIFANALTVFGYVYLFIFIFLPLLILLGALCVCVCIMIYPFYAVWRLAHKRYPWPHAVTNFFRGMCLCLRRGAGACGGRVRRAYVRITDRVNGRPQRNPYDYGSLPARPDSFPTPHYRNIGRVPGTRWVSPPGHRNRWEDWGLDDVEDEIIINTTVDANVQAMDMDLERGDANSISGDINNNNSSKNENRRSGREFSFFRRSNNNSHRNNSNRASAEADIVIDVMTHIPPPPPALSEVPPITDTARDVSVNLSSNASNHSNHSSSNHSSRSSSRHRSHMNNNMVSHSSNIQRRAFSFRGYHAAAGRSSSISVSRSRSMSHKDNTTSSTSNHANTTNDSSNNAAAAEPLSEFRRLRMEREMEEGMSLSGGSSSRSVRSIKSAQQLSQPRLQGSGSSSKSISGSNSNNSSQQNIVVVKRTPTPQQQPSTTPSPITTQTAMAVSTSKTMAQTTQAAATETTVDSKDIELSLSNTSTTDSHASATSDSNSNVVKQADDNAADDIHDEATEAYRRLHNHAHIHNASFMSLSSDGTGSPPKSTGIVQTQLHTPLRTTGDGGLVISLTASEQLLDGNLEDGVPTNNNTVSTLSPSPVTSPSAMTSSDLDLRALLLTEASNGDDDASTDTAKDREVLHTTRSAFALVTSGDNDAGAATAATTTVTIAQDA